MKKIMLVCAAGMSTSLLVKRMQDQAKLRGVEVEIFACGEANAKDYFNDINLLLLGPQVRFNESKFTKMSEGRFKVSVIDMRSYGRVDGKKILEDALALLS